MNMKDTRSCLVSLSRLTVIPDWHFCCLKEFGLMGKLLWMEYNSPRSQDQGRMLHHYYMRQLLLQNDQCSDLVQIESWHCAFQNCLTRHSSKRPPRCMAGVSGRAHTMGGWGRGRWKSGALVGNAPLHRCLHLHCVSSTHHIVTCDVPRHITSSYHQNFEEVQPGKQRMSHTLEAPTHHSPPWH